MPVNIKASGVTAIGAFVFSFLIGLVSGGDLLMVLLRAGILGVGFFVLVICVQFLVHHFLPELTAGESAVADAPPGSKLDISVDDTSDDDSLAALLASAGVDTGQDDAAADSKTTGAPVLDQGGALQYSDNLENKEHFGGLPDLPVSDDEQDRDIEEESDHPAFTNKPNNVNPAKNYSPKDLASAITTMLKQ
jgi:hypothetical protein